MIDRALIRQPQTTRLIGTFAFRDEGDGCIFSKFTNNLGIDIMPESCRLRPETAGFAPFTGTYDTVWLQEQSAETGRILEIETDARQFLLQWSEDGRPEYLGIGMLVQGMLVGAYWFVPIATLNNLNSTNLERANG